MQELIKITEHKGQQIVSARELHTFLEVSSDFTTWCKRMFEYGFEEGKDFSSFLGKSTGGRPMSDFALLIDCAKEISMLQRTEKGKQARLYFIECEKNLKEAVSFKLPQSYSEALRMLADETEAKEAIQRQLNETGKASRPKNSVGIHRNKSLDCIQPLP